MINFEGIDPQEVAYLNSLFMKDVSDLSEDDKAHLRARRHYIRQDESLKQKFASVIDGKHDPKENKQKEDKVNKNLPDGLNDGDDDGDDEAAG